MHEKFMNRAIQLAEEKSARGDCGPFGAVIVRNGIVISEGWNRVVETKDPTAHAEVVAIRNACNKLGTHQMNGCILYASCEPCPMCFAAICWARIESVFYACSSFDAADAGFDDSKIYREISLPVEKRSLRMTCICREEGHKVLRAWVANPNRKPY